MHDDDEPVGRLLSRRQALVTLGLATGAGLAVAAGATTAQAAGRPANTAVDCVAKPEMTEGPYFVDEGLNRSDIRVDTSDGSVSIGTKLTLDLNILQITEGVCAPLAGAQVDIWHCDAAGVYSDEAANDSVGKTFLRGYQLSDSRGRVRFITVLPGWYQGRTVHIHLKVRTTGTDGNPYEFTSQLFFSEEFDAAFLATDPYAAKGTPDTTNATDGIYQTVGDQMLLAPKRQGRGWSACFAIGLDLSDTAVGAPDGGMGGPGGPGGPSGPPPSGPPPSGSPSPSA
jgi:protocatechuate 3,4-dioxygenase beta subunit